MPVDHFAVVLPAPRVRSEESRLGGRVTAGRVRPHEVLRKDDPAFQLHPARVFALRKVHGRAGLPEFLPRRGGFGFQFLERRDRRPLDFRPAVVKRAGKLADASIRRDRQLVARGVHLQDAVFRAVHADRVLEIVGLALDLGRVRRIPRQDPGRVLFTRAKVAGVPSHLNVRVRKIDHDHDLPLGDQRRLDPRAYAVRLHPHKRFDLHRLAVELELGRVQPGPKVEAAPDVPDLGVIDRLKDGISRIAHEPDAAQIGPVRIFTHPRAQGFFFGRVRDVALVRLVASLLKRPGRGHVGGRKPLRQRERVPAPVRHDVSARGLKARPVRVEAELAVPQRNFEIDRVAGDRVPSHDGLPIDRLRKKRRGKHTQ